MSGCLLNIVLDPIFILPWGLGMGAAGAGLATFLSNCVACAYFLILLAVKKGNTYVCIHPKEISLSGKIVAGVCGVGIPASIQNLLNVTGMTILNNLLHPLAPTRWPPWEFLRKSIWFPCMWPWGFPRELCR